MLAKYCGATVTTTPGSTPAYDERHNRCESNFYYQKFMPSVFILRDKDNKVGLAGTTSVKCEKVIQGQPDRSSYGINQSPSFYFSLTVNLGQAPSCGMDYKNGFTMTHDQISFALRTIPCPSQALRFL